LADSRKFAENIFEKKDYFATNSLFLKKSSKLKENK